MLHSMTGFARQSVESDIGTLTWELRAVNHRYLDVQLKLPEELRPQETAFRQLVSQTLSRGKVECSLNFKRALNQSQEMRLDLDLIKLIGSRINDMKVKLNDIGHVDPIDLLRWPGVIQQVEVDAEPLFAEAGALLETTLAAMADMRASEGKRIAEMILSRCDDIEKLAAGVKARMPEVLEASRQKQRDRIEKLDIDADPGRLETELALIATKLDVDEEIDRLGSHVTEIREILKKEEPVGRRLDFLMQELNREANTLGSKSGDTETTKAAVELKVLIEQMREQIQNIE
ncbi:MAG: YicC/YloC family endoribonuclease [Woeseiaceae bacterium]|nr:YicC/YloC family endoribonuclease [Woeseiaceae bacterium]